MLQKAVDSIYTPRQEGIVNDVPLWDMIYVKDFIKQVVEDASNSLKAQTGSYLNLKNKDINFQYGDKTEINNRMIEMSKGDQTKRARFPMFGLIIPFKEPKGGEFESTVRFPEMVIVANTGANETFDARYTEYFRPILYPVYQYFLISLSKKLNIPQLHPQRIKHDKEDVPNIAPKDTGLNEHIDAIRITGLTIPFINSKNNF